MIVVRFAGCAGLLCLSMVACGSATATNPLALPKAGHHELRVLSPTVIELFLVTTKAAQTTPITQWNFALEDGKPNLPSTNAFAVLANNQTVTVTHVGFKRRVLYAPLKARDLRIGNYLYLELATPLPPGVEVVVKDRGSATHLKGLQFNSPVDPLRYSPVLHANETGYLPGWSKKGMVGYYLGSAGELQIKDARGELPKFALISTATGATNFQADLKERSERGFNFNTYRRVYEADFTAFNTPGEYRLFVPGLGSSFPFQIGDEVAGWTARTYALGLYHQRCGTNTAMPFTRFVHAACHTAPAAVPDLTFTNTQRMLGESTDGAEKLPRHKAPQLKNTAASLYPFVRKGKIDVSGGHHDAGDYSKYTINSAGLIHSLVTAVDAFAGVAELDNMGIPESGDGKSDVLQEAKWEADFLAKMQDDDGGFYFLVYPQDRRYEGDVPPEEGDPQLVWPKTTSVTAAAVAALAQCASSPTMKKQFPQAAELYLTKAKKGWDFLKRALAKYGEDGAYQKITHYGNEFLHDDELAWAACELFLATGDDDFHKELTKRLDPSNRATRKWTWMGMYEGYGCAIRSYALATRAGKAQGRRLDIGFTKRCENEILAWADELMRWSEDSSYGTSFPEPTKRVRSAGWYFSPDQAFDIAVAMQLDFPKLKDPRPQYAEAIMANLSYEAGRNPVNVTYITGLGWKRQREIVHQWAQNDRRVLPPSGVPLGNVQGGFGWLEHYKQELGALTFPPDSAEGSGPHGSGPFPFYDRWGDSFNLSQEFVILNQGHGFATWAWVFAQTPLAKQPWKPAAIQITKDSAANAKQDNLRLTLTGADAKDARILWEAEGAEPTFGTELNLHAAHPSWAEVEAQLPDGRLAFAVTNFTTARGTTRTAQRK